MTTQDETTREAPGASADFGRLHATLWALAARVRAATRPPGGTTQELRTLARQIDHLRNQVRCRQADDLRLWLDNLRRRVEAQYDSATATASFALADADDSHAPRDYPAPTLA